MAERIPVPDPEASVLLAAADHLALANDEWTLAVVEAINTGASYEAIAALAGASVEVIEAIAKRRP